MTTLKSAVTTELDWRLEKAKLKGYRSFGGSYEKAVDTLYQQMRREVLSAVNNWHDEKTHHRKKP